MSRRYRTSEVSALTGATERQLQYWREQGLVRASAATPGGQHRYTEADLRRVRLLRLLTQSHRPREHWRPISVRKAALVLESLHRQVESWLEVCEAEAMARTLASRTAREPGSDGVPRATT